MKFVANYDLRIANYLIKKLNSYILVKDKKRKEEDHTKWAQRFHSSDFIVHSLGEGLKINLYKDSVLSKLIFDGFELDEIEFLSDFLKEGDCFVDIGANVGLFSLFASKKVGLSGTVIAFEPSQTTFNRLLENIELNGISNVKPYKLGLSDQEKVLELNISVNGYEAWNTFVKTKSSEFTKKEQVQVKTFDDFFLENSIPTENITLIKLDVEGFELNVLNGAKKLLSQEKAPVFLVEFTDVNANEAGHCCHEIYKLLNMYGYNWYKYDSHLKKLIFSPMQINYPYTNLIAIKGEGNIKVLRIFKFNMHWIKYE
jgi:FkbM family methyltransferase